MGKTSTQTEGGVAIAEKTKTAKPKMYKVIIHNDDYTPMDFVVHILVDFFDRTMDEATDIMLKVHHQGSGIAGIYPKDIAETKSIQVNDYSQANEYPLKTSVEREEK